MNLILPIFLFFGVFCALCNYSDALGNTRISRFDPRRSRLLAMRKPLARSALRARRPTSGSRRRASQMRLISRRRGGINAATSIKNTQNTDTRHVKQTIIIAKTANIMSPIGTQNNEKTAISSRGSGGVQNSSPPRGVSLSSTRQRVLQTGQRRPFGQTSMTGGQRNGRFGSSSQGLGGATFGRGNGHPSNHRHSGNIGGRFGNSGGHGSSLSGNGSPFKAHSGSMVAHGGSFGGNGIPMRNGGHGGSFGTTIGPLGGHGSSFGGNGGGSLNGHGSSFSSNGGSLNGHDRSFGGNGGLLNEHGGSFGRNDGSLSGHGEHVESVGNHGGNTVDHGTGQLSRHSDLHSSGHIVQNNAGHSGSSPNFNIADMLLSGLGVASSSPNLLALMSSGTLNVGGGSGVTNGASSTGRGMPDLTGLFRGKDGARLLNSLVQNIMGNGGGHGGMGVTSPSVVTGPTSLPVNSHGGGGVGSAKVSKNVHGSNVISSGRHAPIIIEAGSNVQVGFRHTNGGPNIVIKSAPTTTTPPPTFLASATSFPGLAGIELEERLP
ncbi:uncharacterized transmembrane protein DDB_G0289901-like [Argopecten irradians]|uniref:uncharacterized transmembrane protein DDB_G0289901-like n=1 Tax=Argopecten irradians TaxID=31199 RepID=UPI003718E5A3